MTKTGLEPALRHKAVVSGIRALDVAVIRNRDDDAGFFARCCNKSHPPKPD